MSSTKSAVMELPRNTLLNSNSSISIGCVPASVSFTLRKISPSIGNLGSGQGVCGLNVNLQDFYVDGGWRSLQLGQLELGVRKALRQAVDKSLPLPIQFKRNRHQPPRQEQSKQPGVGEERCICRRTPLVVTQGSANAGSNQTRRKRAQARDKNIVSRPFQFFPCPERDNVTNPIE